MANSNEHADNDCSYESLSCKNYALENDMFTEEINKHIEEENNCVLQNQKEEFILPNLQISNHINHNVSFDNALNWIGNPGKLNSLLIKFKFKFRF